MLMDWASLLSGVQITGTCESLTDNNPPLPKSQNTLFRFNWTQSIISSLASSLLNSALRHSYIWCLHILSVGVWTFLWECLITMASRRGKGPPRPLSYPDLDHDTDSSLDRRQERWTEAMIQKIHKIQGDDSHCFASCPTLALSTKTYEADVRSKNLPDEIVASVVFWSKLTLLASKASGWSWGQET